MPLPASVAWRTSLGPEQGYNHRPITIFLLEYEHAHFSLNISQIHELPSPTADPYPRVPNPLSFRPPTPHHGAAISQRQCAPAPAAQSPATTTVPEPATECSWSCWPNAYLGPSPAPTSDVHHCCATAGLDR